MFVAAGSLVGLPSCNLIETRQNSSEATGGNSGGSSTVTASGGSGGTKASGGSSSGGAVSSGGSVASGGAGGGNGGAGGSASGGSSSGGTSTGGSSANGGSGAGGAAGSGGSAAGGSTAKGGAGGTSASGGSTSVSNCTDDPAPGQPQTCAEWLSYGMCTQSWFANYCNRTCGRCTGTSQGGAGGASKGGAGGAGGVVGSGGVVSSGGTSSAGGAAGSGGVVGPGTTNPQITGTSGWASRYWDCCKPSCGWTGNSNPPVPSCQKDGLTRISVDAKNGCEGGGTAYECYDFSPWYDAATNMAYGFVAYNGVPCGTCFKLQFAGTGHSGSNAGAAALKGQQMVVQVVNIGGLEANQFDILVPGGGVGQMTAGCTAQWGNVDLGATYGGLLTNCKGDCTCMKSKCQSVFGSLGSALKAGCDWFTSWYSCADNPNLVYTKVTCPSQLTNKTGLSK